MDNPSLDLGRPLEEEAIARREEETEGLSLRWSKRSDEEWGGYRFSRGYGGG
ncbi:hypothetical protein VKT23_017813 [Stygiomarasmius scandens]|uniref:Uncharacterized protein n=1 Tax=Marasmiellus scandens TaxID=2682957 RepID=A0ABR1IQY6_9AGAR